MFFDAEEQGFQRIDPDFFLAHHELFAINAIHSSRLDGTPYGMRNVPTHTEDGIPIRKLYVSNLPPKTNRTELFGVFAQYGFIKSCWMHMGDKGLNKTPTPTYAFVTYSNPADAHKALQAPKHEKVLRGRFLRISPADSWHQPAEDADGRVRWHPRGAPQNPEQNISEGIGAPDTSAENGESSSEPTHPESVENQEAEEQTYNILDILNQDCLMHILKYVPMRDIIRSERVSKSWQNMVHEHLSSMRTFKTSWWQHSALALTTAVLRRVLARVGAQLLRLHIDHHRSTLNDRTAHTVGKFCPNLEELKVVGMHTKNWNPLIYGCKQLKSLSFVSCQKLTDTSLVHLVKNDSCIESLTVANNSHVTGLFLTGSNPQNLTSLAFHNCYALQGTVLCTAIDSLPSITTLKLDFCPISMWKMIPAILKKLPRLKELSLADYSSAEMCLTPQNNDEFCEAISVLMELKTLDLSRNIYITNAVLKQIAQTCTKLESLNVSSCNPRKTFTNAGVGDEGVCAVCARCPLTQLDVSYVSGVGAASVRAAAARHTLRTFVARAAPAVTTQPLVHMLTTCHSLQELDVCGCDYVECDVVRAAVDAVELRPRPLLLRLAGTPAASATECDMPTHKLLTVDIENDLSNARLRPDFIDRIYDDNSDDSMVDLYDNEDFDDFLGADDDLFLDDEDLEDYEGIYAYGLGGPDIILL